MAQTPNIYDLVEPCMRIHDAASRHGTPEMRALARLLLFQLGREIANRTHPVVIVDDV